MTRCLSARDKHHAEVYRHLFGCWKDYESTAQLPIIRTMGHLFLLPYLLATTNNRERLGGQFLTNRSGRGRGRGELGRNRYTRGGIKKKPSNADISTRQEALHPLPILTKPNGPRPSYYTCRHGYESILMDEIQQYALQINAGGNIVTSSPYPGLVHIKDDNEILPTLYDPTYALQCMPQCVVVSADSIKGIAREVLHALLGGEEIETNMDERMKRSREELLAAERGSLTIHPLVPGMCKGQTSPVMQHRSTKIGEEISKILKKSFPAARKAPLIHNDADKGNSKDQWILQMMLQSPTIAVASLTKCQFIGPGKNAYWPNVLHPLGLAKVDIEERMPSSAYRKLMEGIECMGIRPTDTSTVIDLGACPGGWTSVIRRYFNCRVIAVDRSELDPTLMKDPSVTFVKGDAFAYEPPLMNGGDNFWMISDVIAYPERVTELVTRWCANEWASTLIVTMKFQDEPDLKEMHNAIESVVGLGYYCRVKHFFNNKNEVTFMLSKEAHDLAVTRSANLESGDIGTSMYLSL